MVKANVDKILDMLNQKKSISIKELSKALKLNKDDIQKSAEYLEQDGVVKIERKFPKTIVTLVKEVKQSETMPMPPGAQEQPQQVAEKKPLESKPVQAPVQQPAQETAPVQPVQNLQPGQPSPLQVPPKPAEKTKIEVSSTPVQKTEQPELPKNDPLSQSMQDLNMSVPPKLEQKSVEDPMKPMELQPGSSQKPVLQQDTESPKLEIAQNKVQPNFDQDPLSQDAPNFNLATPFPSTEKKPVLSYTDQFKANIDVKFPDYVKTEAEKIDYLIENINNKFANQDYKNLNVMYRKVYEIHQNSNNLSTNEKYLLGEKLNDLFDKIKQIYLVREVV